MAVTLKTKFANRGKVAAKNQEGGLRLPYKMLTIEFSAVILICGVFCSAEIGGKLSRVAAQFNSGDSSPKPRNIHQWNVAVVLPTNEELPHQPPKSAQPPVATSPGFVWLQVPEAHFSKKPSSGSPTINHLPPKQETLSQNPQSTSSLVDTQTPSSSTGVKGKCLRSNGLFPTNVCNKFINCWNGVATEQACPDGLVFNARGLYCDYPDRVDCKQRSTASLSDPLVVQGNVPVSTVHTTQTPQSSVVHTTQIIPSHTTVGALNTGCLRLRGQFPTDQCNKYVNCWDGVAVEQFCPAGLLFNPSKLHCDYPENVNCNGKVSLGSREELQEGKLSTSRPVTQTSSAPAVLGDTGSLVSSPIINTVSTVDPALKRKCLKPRGIFPSTACNKFVSCNDDVIQEIECPEGFLFSTNGYCDAADNVNCAERTKMIKDVTSEKNCPQTSGTFRDKEKCNTYYTCVFNKVIARFQCPEGLNFNDKLGICDYADRVQCSKVSLDHKQKDVIKSECPLENGTFREKNKCNSYYTCLNNRIVAKYQCPDGFNFNDNIGVCDYANRVDCSKEPLIYQGRAGVHPQLPKKDECGVEFGTFRDSKNCSSYYTCASRKIVAKYDCPQGFSFNDELGVCDYAERVDCTKPPKIFQVKANAIGQFPPDFQEKVDKCKSGTMFPLNPQCTSVCLCRNGMAEIVQCPAGLAYDSRSDKCILPHVARC